MTRETFHRTAAFVVSFVAAAYGVWSFSGAVLEWAGEVPRLPMVLDFIPELRRWQAGMRQEHGHPRVALLGDSVLLGDGYSKTVPMDVRRAVWLRHGAGPAPTIHPLAWPGIGPIGEYCVIDEVIAARPDLVVVEVNLRTIGAGPLGPASYPELAGFIDGDRLLEAARLPLADAGITLDRLLMYRALIASGHEMEWEYFANRQARLLHLRDTFEEWLDELLGTNELADRRVVLGLSAYAKILVPGRNRAQRAQADRNLHAALDGVSKDGSRLRVLGAGLERLRRAGVRTLVWAAPVNIEYLKTLGFAVDGIDRSAESVRRVVEAHGASFVDLHWMLPDDAFVDSGDHVTFEEPVDGTAMLGSRLAREITSALAETDREQDGSRSEDSNRALQ